MKALDRGARPMRMIIIVLALVGTVQVCFMIVVELRRGYVAREAIERLEADVAELEAESARLSAVLEHGDDDAYREQLARRQGFIRPDETRVVIIGVP